MTYPLGKLYPACQSCCVAPPLRQGSTVIRREMAESSVSGPGWGLWWYRLCPCPSCSGAEHWDKASMVCQRLNTEGRLGKGVPVVTQRCSEINYPKAPV